jgi:AraC family ethanolamine operon transcriptional activator
MIDAEDDRSGERSGGDESMTGASAAGATHLAALASTRYLQDGDLDRVAASIQGWETRLTQLTPGHGHGSVSETVLPSARLVRLAVDTSAALEALPLAPRPDELLHIGTISARSEPVLWQGFSVLPDMLMLEEGKVPSSFAMPAGCELLVARLDRTRIDSLTRVLRGTEAEPAGRRTQLRPQSASAVAELNSRLRALVRGDLAGHAELIGPAEDDLYERVASMLAAPATPLQPSPESRRRALRRAEEFMDAHARERISLSDLCRASESCERTLRQAFRECYGTSPMAFLKKLRLQGLRQDLRDSSPHATTVLQLALRWGFWHMGHLGRDYRSLFGETPSETLSGTRSPGGGAAESIEWRRAPAKRSSLPSRPLSLRRIAARARASTIEAST